MTPERARELACEIIHGGESCADFRSKDGSEVCEYVATLLVLETAGADALLREVAISGVEMDTAMGYLCVQINRKVWGEIQARYAGKEAGR